MKKTLALRSEALTELATSDLARVAGAAGYSFTICVQICDRVKELTDFCW